MFCFLLLSLSSSLVLSFIFSFIFSFISFLLSLLSSLLSCLLVSSVFSSLSVSVSVSVFFLFSLPLNISVFFLCLREVLWSCCCGVVWCVMLCCVVLGLVTRCGVWGVSVQNVPVCTCITRTCWNTCARGASTHGDVSNVHTGCMGEGRGLSSASCFSSENYEQQLNPMSGSCLIANFLLTKIGPRSYKGQTN